MQVKHKAKSEMYITKRRGDGQKSVSSERKSDKAIDKSATPWGRAQSRRSKRWGNLWGHFGPLDQSAKQRAKAKQSRTKGQRGVSGRKRYFCQLSATFCAAEPFECKLEWQSPRLQDIILFHLPEWWNNPSGSVSCSLRPTATVWPCLVHNCACVFSCICYENAVQALVLAALYSGTGRCGNGLVHRCCKVWMGRLDSSYGSSKRSLVS